MVYTCETYHPKTKKRCGEEASFLYASRFICESCAESFIKNGANPAPMRIKEDSKGAVSMVSDKEKLDGAQAKIQMLKEHLIKQEEQNDKLIFALWQICMAHDKLPENWRAKLAVGFSPVEFVETVEEVIPTISTYLPEPFSDFSHLEEITSMPTLDEIAEWKKGWAQVDTSKAK